MCHPPHWAFVRTNDRDLVYIFAACLLLIKEFGFLSGVCLGQCVRHQFDRSTGREAAVRT